MENNGHGSSESHGGSGAGFRLPGLHGGSEGRAGAGRQDRHGWSVLSAGGRPGHPLRRTPPLEEGRHEFRRFFPAEKHHHLVSHRPGRHRRRLGYGRLGKLEDPSFTIKTAAISTTYPEPRGEVEEEVTALIESAAQKLGQTDKVRSLSKEGVSIVYVDIKDTYTAKDLPQIWDEIRRKYRISSPASPGSGPVGGERRLRRCLRRIFRPHGDGYTFRELEDHGDFLRRELLLVPGVQKWKSPASSRRSSTWRMDRTRMAALGISLDEISNLLSAQNVVAGAGSAAVGPELLRIAPRLLFVPGRPGKPSAPGRLRADPPARRHRSVSRATWNLRQGPLRFNGKPASA